MFQAQPRIDRRRLAFPSHHRGLRLGESRQFALGERQCFHGQVWICGDVCRNKKVKKKVFWMGKMQGLSLLWDDILELFDCMYVVRVAVFESDLYEDSVLDLIGVAGSMGRITE